MTNYIEEKEEIIVVSRKLVPAIVFDPINNRGDDGTPRLELVWVAEKNNRLTIILGKESNNELSINKNSARKFAEFFTNVAELLAESK